MKRRSIFCLFLILVILISPLHSVLAWQSSTLYNGCKGEEVRLMQQALIDLGFLKGTADGIFGNNTEKAVRNFQRDNKLTSDGLAGAKTLTILYQKQTGLQAASAEPVETPVSEAQAPAATPAPAPAVSEGSSSGLFGNDYSTLRSGSSGSRVKVLQQALNKLGYSCGSADGKFGAKTSKAVIAFQSANHLKADGLAGKKTLTALEKAYSKKSGGSTQEEQSPVATQTPAPVATTAPVTELNAKIAGPDGSSVQLLHWFNDIKNKKAKAGQQVLIYDPSTGLSWTLRLLSLGRHADAEPLTAQDTATMLEAFGGKNTWNQKAVYVRLPDGTWTVGSTHDTPHLSGNIKDNNFDGHLCVHFLRDMDECKKNDPDYGVSNQETIRSFWKSLTGEEITN